MEKKEVVFLTACAASSGSARRSKAALEGGSAEGEAVLARGAEAVLVKRVAKDGAVVCKRRGPKAYRHPELDARLRRARTRREARLLERAARLGVAVPALVAVDEKACTLTVRFLQGPVLARRQSLALYRQAGALAGRLHAGGVIHGDLTPHNFILHNKRVFLLDFGLGFYSTRLEDQAVDLLNMKKSLAVTHPCAGRAWQAFVEGYRRFAPRARDALASLAQVEHRARYS